MGRSSRISLIVRAALLALSLVLPRAPVGAWAAERPNFDDANASFLRLPPRDRNELYLMLIATGDFNAMVSEQFGGRLYDAIAAFQAKQGLEAIGVVTPETVLRLRQVGGRIFNAWQFGFLDHPSADASLVVPGRFGLTRTRSERGWTLENAARTMSIDFSFFADGTATLSDVFGRLTRPQPGKRVDMQVLRADFFAVAGSTGNTSNYSRYIPVPGGIAGFTVSWNVAAFPNASRVAVVMANELYPHRMVDDPAAGDLFETSPRSRPATPGGLVSEATPISPVYTPSPAEQQREQERVADRERLAEEERVRQQKLREDQLVLQHQTEEARKEAELRLRQERFERVAAGAKPLVDDASAFVKAEPTNPKVLDYVQAIGELNATLSGSDPDETERQSAALGVALKRDPSFGRFQAERAKERQRQNARYLTDALKALGTRKAFLLKVVTQDPTSANARKLLPFIKDADAALSAPDLDGARAAMGKIDLAVQDAGLKNDLAAFQQKDAVDAPREGRGVQLPSPPLPATDKNRFLRDGDLLDVVLMYNSSATAPHVFKNLRGDIVFDGRADVCLFGRDSADDTLGQQVTETLKNYPTARQVFLAPGTCDPERVASQDVIAARRGTFLHQDPQYALSLIRAIETDDFKSLVTVSDAQMKAKAAADAVKATGIAAEVDRGGKDGFGLLLLQTKSPAVCMVVPEPTEAHRAALLAHNDKLSTDMDDTPTFAPTPIDEAFVKTKHGQCGALYGAAGDLKELAGGLKRDGVTFRFSTIWVAPRDLQGADAQADGAKAADTKAADAKPADGALPDGRQSTDHR